MNVQNMKPTRLYIFSLICKVLPPSRCLRLKASLLRWCGAKVGDNVEIMSSVKIIGDMELVIGDNVFIGAGCIILPGTRIGNNCIVGAGTVCSGIIPDNSVIAGNKWRVIGETTEWAKKRIEQEK